MTVEEGRTEGDRGGQCSHTLRIPQKMTSGLVLKVPHLEGEWAPARDQVLSPVSSEGESEGVGNLEKSSVFWNSSSWSFQRLL